MPIVELNVSQSTVQERCDMAAAMVRNGYRVCLTVKKIQNVKKTFLVIDRPGEDPPAK